MSDNADKATLGTAGIYVDHERATAMLKTIADQQAVQRAAHATVGPEYPVAAAGVGFGAYGERLQAALESVHRRGQLSLSRMEDTALAAVEQVAVVALADGASAAALQPEAVEP